MKKPLFVAVTDIHLDQTNFNQRQELFDQIITLMDNWGIFNLMMLGDIFESRKAIPENVLNAFGDILLKLSDSNISTYCIPGNHDKLVYTKKESYLTPFSYYPDFRLIEDFDDLYIGHPSGYGVDVVFAPFFEESVWVEKFEKFFKNREANQNEILISHIAVTGSQNNNGELVDNGISKKMFDRFGKTFLGHYHNTQEVSEKIIHLPSICQKNFGEDPNKGVSIVYDDLSYEVINLNFRKFVNVEIDLSISTKTQIDKVISDAVKTGAYVKAKFSGTEAEIKSIDKDSLTRLGVKVQTKMKEIEDSVEYSKSEEIKEYDKASLLEAFKDFCGEEGIDFEFGLKFLK